MRDWRRSLASITKAVIGSGALRFISSRSVEFRRSELRSTNRPDIQILGFNSCAPIRRRVVLSPQ